MTRQSDPVCHTSDSSACEFVNIDYVPGIELECGQVLPEHISVPVPVLMSDPTFVEFDLEDIFSADTVQVTYAVDSSTDFVEHVHKNCQLVIAVRLTICMQKQNL